MITKIIKEKNDKDSIFIYIPNFLKKNKIKKLYNNLNLIKDYKENHNFNHTKIIRLQKWYHTNNKYFCPKWKYKYDRWISHNYELFLLDIQNEIQNKIQNKINFNLNNQQIPKINSLLLNKYRNGQDTIRPHQDTKLTFGEYPTILGLSIGEKRDIIFTNIKNKKKFNFTLESGSLFIMAGSSQKYYTHEIPKTNSQNHRYSLTFRETIFK